MFKFYSKTQILYQISDKLKSLDDFLRLSPDEFDRESCDYWYDEYLEDPEYQERGYICNSKDKEFFYSAFYLMEIRPECNFLCLVEVDDSLYFVFSRMGLINLKSHLYKRREKLLLEVSGLTQLLPFLDDDATYESGYVPFSAILEHFVPYPF